MLWYSKFMSIYDRCQELDVKDNWCASSAIKAQPDNGHFKKEALSLTVANTLREVGLGNM